MTTLIAHFYNEEYLLPWWLNHHKDMFDHGILIDYHSTDRSVEIIQEICPTWQIVKSKNLTFDAPLVDQEVMGIENTISGYKIVLNITEFLVNRSDKCLDELFNQTEETCYAILRANIVDENIKEHVTYNDNLIEKKRYGVLGSVGLHAPYRFIHNCPKGNYHVGRHDVFLPVDRTDLPLLIFWYGFAPWNEHLIKRKTQIKSKIPQSNIDASMGTHHLWDLKKMEEFKDNLLKSAVEIAIKI
jgi:hypothetical protein